MKSHEHLRGRDPDDARTDASPAPPQPAPLEHLASAIGNQAFASIARDGAGILASGMAHPAVESAIARRRGRGAPLESGARERLEAGLGEPLGDVRIHTDSEADALARSVSARAFTTGNDVYFAAGEYQPGTSEGNRLLAHEISHVAQQRGAPTSGPLRVSQPGEPLEREADAVSRELG